MGRIGIDLGTTNSVVTSFVRQSVDVIVSREGHRFVPSMVAPRPGGALVGHRAKARYPDVFFSVKRLIGRRFSDSVVAQVAKNVPYEIVAAPSPDGRADEIRVKLGETLMSPVEVSAAILRKIKEDAEVWLREPVTHAVITVPAYFLDAQRAATREAGGMAGLRVSQILDEPVAAALAFGVAQGGEGVRRVLVYDLGGGTFDISLITIIEGAPLVETTEGDVFCGGDDFDFMIMDHVLEVVDGAARTRGAAEKLRANRKFLGQLKERAEQAKFELGQSTTADVAILGARVGREEEIDVEVTIHREDFERWIRPRLEHTIELMHKALTSAQLSPGEIDDVLLVGGSTAIPLVRELLRKEFGADKLRPDVNPMECVALGAGIRAREQTKIICPKKECTHANDDDVKFCEGMIEKVACRYPLEHVAPQRICPRCEGRTEETAVQCPTCGHVFVVVGGKRAQPIGIALAGDRYHVIIPKDTAFPLEDPIYETFRTTVDNQAVVLVEVSEGTSEVASRNAWLGAVEVPIPDGARGPAGLQIRIGLAMDRDGIVTVSARGLGPLAPVRLDVKLDRRPTTKGTDGTVKTRPCPSCREENSYDCQVCQKCGAKFGPERPPEWKGDLGRLETILSVMADDCSWFLKPEQLQMVEQFRRDAGEAQAANDEARGRLVAQQISDALYRGTFTGVMDLVLANTYMRFGTYVTPEQRARMSQLLGDFKKSLGPGQEAQADRLREAIRDLLKEMQESGPQGAGSEIDLRPDRT